MGTWQTVSATDGSMNRPTFTMEKPAGYITFNSITDNPALYNGMRDERDFVKVAASQDTNGIVESLSVTDGQEAYVLAYVHNNAALNLGLVARDVMAKFDLNENLQLVNGKYVKTVTGWINSSNAEPKSVYDDAKFTADKPFSVSYVQGSAQYANALGKFAIGNPTVGSGALLGYDSMNGEIPGCMEYSGWVSFKVKIEFDESQVFSDSAQKPSSWAVEQVNAAITIYIDGQQTNLGDSIVEQNGWHFVEATAFSEAFEFPIILDTIREEMSAFLGVPLRRIEFLLNEVSADYFWHSVDDDIHFDKHQLILDFATINGRFDDISADNVSPSGLFFVSQSVFGRSFWIEEDKWITADYFTGGNGAYYSVLLDMLDDIDDDRVRGGKLIDDLDKGNYETFPESLIINGNMYIPLEIALWFLGYSFTCNNGEFRIDTTDSHLDLRPISVANQSPQREQSSSWAVEQVNAAIAEGLVSLGLQSNYTQATTRAEFAALAVALYENVKGEITGRITFIDTDDANVEKAAYIGVVMGVGENRFAPDSSLTREQAATMLSRLATAVGMPLDKQDSTFADNDQISDWAIEAVGQMQTTGIMQGVGDNRFSPKSPYTREQSIITIMRTFDILHTPQDFDLSALSTIEWSIDGFLLGSTDTDRHPIHFLFNKETGKNNEQ
jgi:hypothetical protein